MPQKRSAVLTGLNACHLYHLLRGHPLFGDRSGGYGGLWPDVPFDEQAARQTWQAIRSVFLPWWQQRYPDCLPWAEAVFVDGEPWERWDWNTQRHGRLLDVCREFLGVPSEKSTAQNDRESTNSHRREV
jgi:hypothetical protein